MTNGEKFREIFGFTSGTKICPSEDEFDCTELSCSDCKYYEWESEDYTGPTNSDRVSHVITVGDEVVTTSADSRAIVTKDSVCMDAERCYLLFDDGSSSIDRKDALTWTGRHFDVITDVLSQME